MAPTVELLYWDGCPSWPEALEQLRAEMRALGLPAEDVAVVEVTGDEQAEALGFPGSPTIRVDGRDVEPVPEEPAALTCRVYRTHDGRVSPLPDPAQVRGALRAALGNRAA